MSGRFSIMLHAIQIFQNKTNITNVKKKNYTHTHAVKDSKNEQREKKHIEKAKRYEKCKLITKHLFIHTRDSSIYSVVDFFSGSCCHDCVERNVLDLI